MRQSLHVQQDIVLRNGCEFPNQFHHVVTLSEIDRAFAPSVFQDKPLFELIHLTGGPTLSFNFFFECWIQLLINVHVFRRELVTLVAQKFFARLKAELADTFASLHDAQRELLDPRLHSSLKFTTPQLYVKNIGTKQKQAG